MCFPDMQTLDQFYQKVPAWSDRKQSYVFFRDDPRLLLREDVLVQRAQLSGLCYIHAPNVLQHYLVSLHQKTPAGMVDILRLIRDTFTAEELEAHIFRNDGQSSSSMLKRILEPGSKIISTHLNFVEQNLKEFGPLLVSGFSVFPDFQQPSSVHHGLPEGTRKGSHAMIIIGVRKTAERDFYLLQNWWRNQPFVEVDKQYMIECEPSCWYVPTPQERIPDRLPQYQERWAENEMYLDKPDTLACNEGPLIGVDFSLL